MSTLILQLTDIHAKSSFRIGKDDKKIYGIIRALPKPNNLEHIIFALTGDLTYSGETEEFDSFHKLLVELKKECERNFNISPTVIAVPGNHDITHCDAFSKIDFKSVTDFNTFYTGYNAHLTEFFNCCKKEDMLHPESSCKVISLGSWGEHAINYVLINTAPGSLISDNDRGNHFLPLEVFDAFPQNPNAINILLMHHGLDHLEEESRKRIELAINQNATIILAGHDHKGKSSWYGENGNIRIVKGGEFQQDQWYESSFKCIELLDNERAFESHYCWNHDEDSFALVAKEEITGPLHVSLFSHRESVSLFTGKNHLLLADSMEEQFVFPNLRVASNSASGSASILPDTSSVLQLIEDHHFIAILGGALCGKSTLLTQIYIASIAHGMKSIYLTRDNYTRSIRKTISNVITEQWGQYGSSSQFSHLPLEKRVIFIDDFDALDFKNKQIDTINEIYSQFGTIVCTMKDGANQFRANLEEVAEAPLYLQIGKFSKSKRDHLIVKACASRGIESGKERESIIRAIDSAVHEYSSLFPLTPGFICEYLHYLLNSNEVQDYRDLRPFSDIYEKNLMHGLKSKANNIIKGSKYQKRDIIRFAIELFSELALHMYSQRLSQIGLTEFSELTRSYLQKRAVQDITPKEALDLGISSGILAQDPQTFSIEFARSEYYAFFVARSLNNNRFLHESQELIKRILEELCFGINELVIVFLSLHKEDRDLIKLICNLALGSVEDINPADFCMGFDALKECASIGPSITNESKRKKGNKMIDQMEQEQTLNELTYRDVFDYGLSELSKPGYRIARSIRLTEIAGDSISSQFLTMYADDKNSIRTVIFEVPKRAVGYLIPPLLQDLDSNAQKLSTMLKNESGQPCSIDACRQMLQGFSLCLCICLYSAIAYHCSRRCTYEYLTCIESTDVCDTVMKLAILANSEDYRAFCDRACKEAKNALKTNNRLLQLCIAIIVNMFIDTNPSVPHNLLDRFSENVFASFEDKGQAKARLVSENRRVAAF